MNSSPTSPLMSIGRFAALTGLPITTLRHYDEIGLLRPAKVDHDTGYRRYLPAQAVTAGLIRRLRERDVPIAEVIELLEAIGDPARLALLLEAQAARLAMAAAAAAEAQEQFTHLAKELFDMATTTAEQVVGPLAAVRIFCRDLDVARRFYRDQLGLTELTVDSRWVVYDVGSAQLIVEPVPEGEPEGDAVGRFAGFSFAVTDVDAACAELAARGVKIVGQPEVQPWGGTLAHVADPDGNVITLVKYPEKG
jgi:DNA-binding transcriptional MerR regulator